MMSLLVSSVIVPNFAAPMVAYLCDNRPGPYYPVVLPINAMFSRVNCYYGPFPMVP